MTKQKLAKKMLISTKSFQMKILGWQHIGPRSMRKGKVTQNTIYLYVNNNIDLAAAIGSKSSTGTKVGQPAMRYFQLL